MDVNKYIDNSLYGRAVAGDYEHDFTYYRPHIINRKLVLSNETITKLSKAESAFGKFIGLTNFLNDSDILLAPLIAIEAVASSKIEGTNATITDLLESQSDEVDIKNQDLLEVKNYLEAIYVSQELLKKLPISVRFLKELHKILLKNVRGGHTYLGEIRKSPVWIGKPGGILQEARYVPPPSTEMVNELLDDWEDYVNNFTSIRPILKAAIAHYQFETIHPFLDVNGRIGRLLISVILQNEGELDNPLLYLSGYFEHYRDSYYKTLQEVREKGNIESYLNFFLDAVFYACTDAYSRVSRLVSLREKYIKECLNEKSQLTFVVGLLFNRPYLNSTILIDEISRVTANSISRATANNILKKAELLGWIENYDVKGRGGSIQYRAKEILEVLSDDPGYTI